jgi:formylglycine-generating enzyme required for sulfatase activity
VKGTRLAAVCLLAVVTGCSKTSPSSSQPPPSATMASVSPPASSPPPPPAASPCPTGMGLVAAGGERFCADVTEVTVDAYAACAAAGKCAKAESTVAGSNLQWEPRKGFDSVCNAGKPGRGSHPLNCVAQPQAAAYCAFVQKRLPTSAEWRLAAVGDDGRRYPWGSTPPDVKSANLCDRDCVAASKGDGPLAVLGGLTNGRMKPIVQGSDGYALTAPVGSFPAGRNQFGLDDMVGNVSEWVAGMTKQGAPPDHPPFDEYHSWGSSFWDADPTRLLDQSVGGESFARDPSVGFRCVKDL